MNINRYIPMQAVLTEDNQLVPLWHNDIIYKKDNYYGNRVELKDDRQTLRLVECVFDLKTKQLSEGIEVNYYPNINDLNFKIGQIYLVEKNDFSAPRTLIKTTLVDI